MSTHAYKNNSSRYDYSDQFKSTIVIEPKQSLSWKRKSSFINPLLVPFENNHNFSEKINSVVREKKMMSLLYAFFNIAIGVVGFYMVQHFFPAEMPFPVLIFFLAMFSLEVPLGLYQLYRHTQSMSFNQAKQQFSSTSLLTKKVVNFHEIAAVQLLHYTRTNNSHHSLTSTHIYEMNLVLKDQTRIYLSQYLNKKETAFENAQTIAGFMNIQVIDQLSEEVLSLK